MNDPFTIGHGDKVVPVHHDPSKHDHFFGVVTGRELYDCLGGEPHEWTYVRWRNAAGVPEENVVRHHRSEIVTCIDPDRK